MLRYRAGSAGPTELPFADLDHPTGVAVDDKGAVHVGDWLNDRVVKAEPG